MATTATVQIGKSAGGSFLLFTLFYILLLLIFFSITSSVIHVHVRSSNRIIVVAHRRTIHTSCITQPQQCRSNTRKHMDRGSPQVAVPGRLTAEEAAIHTSRHTALLVVAQRHQRRRRIIPNRIALPRSAYAPQQPPASCTSSSIQRGGSATIGPWLFPWPSCITFG